jgi:hypothetical protein
MRLSLIKGYTDIIDLSSLGSSISGHSEELVVKCFSKRPGIYVSNHCYSNSSTKIFKVTEDMSTNKVK